jgi:hypothetical protein
MYFNVSFLTLVLCATFVHASFWHPDNQHALQSLHHETKFIFRDAVKEDAADLSAVLYSAFSPSPTWSYARPDHAKFANYTQYCMRRTLEQMWEYIHWNSTFAKVVAIPDREQLGGSERTERVVAFGIWNRLENGTSVMRSENAVDPLLKILLTGLMRQKEQIETDTTMTEECDCAANLDTNLTRFDDYERQFSALKTKYIDKAYEEQFYLNTLATHSDWEGRGFASLNLRWGMQYAKEHQIPATLMASPIGYPVYDHYGFQSLKNVTIGTLEDYEGEGIWYEVMEWSG